uniref:RING-type domain-containing protein n=1 Tax=viral metagenome TaxID=1070528 RepID=A0A6C0KWV0_9ZZZZ|tara:strand:- start:16358 stop:17155 length:798 start_codon:yes stop_codon:yes gene_type:complete
MSRWNQQSNNEQSMNNILRIHLNNINILANTIQNSQQIIERYQRNDMIDNRTTSNLTSSLFESVFNGDSTPHTRTMRNHRRNQQNNTETTNTGINASSSPNVGTNTIPTNIRPTTRATTARTSSNILDQNYHYDNADNIYYFTFDTLGLGSTALNNSTNVYTSGLSFETLLITEENEHIISNIDTSANIDDLSYNLNDYHLYEITHFDLIMNPMNDVCPITRERFDSTTEHILMIKNCRHIFNKSALKIWLEQNNSCPCCRSNIM